MKQNMECPRLNTPQLDTEGGVMGGLVVTGVQYDDCPDYDVCPLQETVVIRARDRGFMGVLGRTSVTRACFATGESVTQDKMWLTSGSHELHP